LVIGSDKKFSGKDTFFRTHGNFEIKDRDYYEEKTGIALLGQWGFDDQHTYSFAKEELMSLASKKGPFCMFMETVDTHTPSNNAYIPGTCKEQYKDHYANALACASKQVKDFVDWIKAQSFYKDTTIIIVGDHLNMDNAVFTDADLSFGRRPLNIFINSKARTENFKNRDFTTLDMFPSILASIGVKIEGDRVGLGQSLFGNDKTLLEQKGYDWLNNELSKSSEMYDHFLY
jgi:phosphoglycerol transferase